MLINNIVDINNTKKINYISLFSGIGSFEYSLEKAFGKDNLNCLGYSEIEKNAINIYSKNYSSHKNLGDINLIDWNTLKNQISLEGGLDLIVGGSPCQSFSIQGKREGLFDARGSLVLKFVESIQALNPNYFIFENVRGLASINGGKVFEFLQETFKALGYTISYEILNAKDFGAPQNRERLIIVGSKIGLGKKFKFNRGNKLSSSILKDVIDENAKEVVYMNNDRVKSIHSKNFISDKPQNIYKVCSCITKAGTPKWVLFKDGKVIKEKNFILRYNKGLLSENELVGLEGRYLTSNELEKIQGLPKDYTLGVSRLSRKQLIGNAINIFMLDEVISSFKEMLETKTTTLTLALNTNRVKGDFDFSKKVVISGYKSQSSLKLVDSSFTLNIINKKGDELEVKNKIKYESLEINKNSFYLKSDQN